MHDPEETTPLEGPSDPDATTPYGTDPESAFEPIRPTPAHRQPLPDRFVRVRPLGEGGAGIVWLVEDRELGREVALKVLGAAAGHPIAQERFKREAKTAAALRHDNLVRIHDAAFDDGCMWLAMEAVDGGSMEDWLGAEERSPRDVARLVAQVADGLQVVHDAGLVHRDVKPGNILVTTEGVAKLTDFGLVHDAEATRLTHTGATVGTPVYMAPEQVASRTGDVTARTDVHALGGVLYRALVGRPPHLADTADELYRRVTEGDPEPPTRVDARIPRDLETVALVALSRDPRDRYASAAAVADDLRRWLDGRPITARQPSGAIRALRAGQRQWKRVAAVAGVVVAGVVVAVSLTNGSAARPRDPTNAPNAADAAHTRRAQAALAPARRALADLLARQYDDDARRASETMATVAVALAACDEADRMGPALASTAYYRGRALAASGRFDGAEAAFTTAIGIDPGHGPARLHLARALVMKALMINAEPGRRHQAAARGKLRASYVGRAQATIEEALRARTLTDPVEQALAETYVKLADQTEGAARRLAAHCADARKRLAGRPGVEEFGFLEGYATLDLGVIDAVVEARPFWPEALFLRALTRRIKGRVADAESDCTKVLEAWPDFVPALVVRSSVRYNRGQIEEARSDLERAVAADAGSVAAWTGLGLVHVRRRAFDDAIAALDNAIKLSPDDAQSRVWRAEALSFLGRLDEALEEINRAIARDPLLDDAWYDKALMQLRLPKDRINEAREALEKVAEISKNGAKAVNARRNLCALHVMFGRTKDARRELDLVLAAYDRPEDAALLEALVLDAEGKGDAAILALDRGLGARGDVAELLFMRGHLRLDRGDDAAALTDLRRALDLPLSVRVPTQTGTRLHFYGRHLLEAVRRSIERRLASDADSRLTRRLEAVDARVETVLQ